jgi:hypothetical protein
MSLENNKESRENITASIPASLREAVIQKAEADRRPLSWVVEDLLRKALESEQKQGAAP